MQKENCYFAAGNTVNGFVSYYDEIFNDSESLYIIKGGSGTGKSRLLRVLGEAGKNNNKSVEYFYCSFDPSSLDGIIIDNKIAIVDGTAPHICEPRIPGAKDNLIDVGQFWNSDILACRKKEISELSDEKRMCFDMAYIYLNAIGRIIESSRKIASKCITRDESGRKTVSACVSKKVKTRIRSAFGKNGITELDSYSLSSEEIVKISDELKTFLIGPYLNDLILSKDPRIDAAMLSFDPLEKNIPDAILTSKGKCIEKCDTDGSYDISEMLNGQRKDIKNALSDNYHIYNELLANAKLWLQRASLFHFELEKIYISSMDFDAKEKYTEKLVETIINKL